MIKNTVYFRYQSPAKVNSKKGRLFKYLNQIDSGERKTRIYNAIYNYYYPKAIKHLGTVSGHEFKEITRKCIGDLWGQIQSLAIIAGLDVEEMLGRRVNSVGEAKAPSTVELSQQSSEDSSKEEKKEEEKEKTKSELIMEARKKETERHFPIDNDNNPEGEDVLNSMIESF
ncbi:hypothetical protein FRE64_16505 (plasmid) [Euhalothece natronophila Z-M001]|uniref:Uncharacterized protein n=1 Tax=Euhalothece natronophila Z-M001 TaxID=522448 RepID=A0A5B8NTB3_9CHRO|nr:hypothetical protein [Euhalothece natronophila]QDZ41575.1 hypothetical protein FRE64_16505 [Euhalothece natronophila Z-M001]